MKVQSSLMKATLLFFLFFTVHVGCRVYQPRLVIKSNNKTSKISYKKNNADPKVLVEKVGRTGVPRKNQGH